MAGVGGRVSRNPRGRTVTPTDLTDWLEFQSRKESVWYVKRLSANDTLANGAHQAGPYIPRDTLLGLIPDLDRPDELNPRIHLDVHIDSHGGRRRASAIWYNNKYHGGTRNETRLTGFGGLDSALLDPDNTGAVGVFAFSVDEKSCNVWVCRNRAEEAIVEDRVGIVEPGRSVIWQSGRSMVPGSSDDRSGSRRRCWLDPEEIPTEWIVKFPSAADIVARAVEMRPEVSADPDKRLLRRRDCEFEIFKSVEEAQELPTITAGFATMDEFLARAQTILQRRKSRSGRSLELHVRSIFTEEGLCEDRHFSHQRESEPGRRPDFLFPSATAYRNPSFPNDRLRMLAVKTTCRDRWRQVLNEADRVRTKHLLTLQEGVSEGQYREMRDAGVRLVIPNPSMRKFPKSIQPELQSLGDFIADTRRITMANAGL